MKENEYFDPQLIAPCGMNCALCSSYLAYKNQIPRINRSIIYCKGCRPRNKQCSFVKKKCPNKKLLNSEINFCFECELYPCEVIKHLDNGYKKRFGMSMIENLNIIMTEGLDTLLRKEYEKYKCKNCDGLISIHNKLCFKCEKIEKMQ